MDIKIDDLTNPDVRALVQTHRAEMAGRDHAVISNALGLDELQAGDVTFFSVWEGETTAKLNPCIPPDAFAAKVLAQPCSFI